MKEKNQIYYKIVVFVIALLVADMFFYASNMTIPYNSDDAGTPTAYYYLLERGTKILNIPIWSVSSIIDIVCFKIWGYSSAMSYGGFIIRYSLCVLLLLMILWDNKKSCQRNMFAVCIFLLMGIYPFYIIRWHFAPQMFSLLTIYCVINRKKLGYKYYILLLVALMWSIVDYDILVFSSCWGPYIIWRMVDSWKKIKDKWKMTSVIMVSLVLIILTVVLKNYKFTGYGSYAGLIWPETSYLQTRMPALIEGMLSIFNIYDPGQDIISIRSVSIVLKLMLLIYGIYLSIKSLFSHKEYDVMFFMGISFWIQIFTLFLNQDNRAIGIRYAPTIYWLLIIMVSLSLTSKYEVFYEQIEGKTKRMITVCVLTFSVLFSELYGADLKFLPQSSVSGIIQYVEEKNCKELYGLATFWNANVASVETHGKLYLQSIALGDQSLVASEVTYQEYKEGFNKFNYIFLTTEENENMEEKIEEFYGTPLSIDNYGQFVIYKFDYDIRKPKIELLQDEIVLKPGEEKIIGEVNLITGKNMLELFSDQFLMEVWCEDKDGDKVSIQELEQNKGQQLYECDYVGDTLATLHIKNISEEDIIVKSADFFHESLALESSDKHIGWEINIDGKDEQNYDISVVGENVKDDEMKFYLDGERIYPEVIIDGKTKRTYRLRTMRTLLTVRNISEKNKVYIETTYDCR